MEQIGRIISTIITKGNVVKCTRVAKLNKVFSRPRSVVVKISTSLLRDNFLAELINLNTAHLWLSGDKKPAFISEHLSSTAKDIYVAARIFAKEKNSRCVWSRNGNIFLRKSISSDKL